MTQNKISVKENATTRQTLFQFFIENLRGVPTATIDARGIKHTFLINELDQIVRTVAAADVSQSPSIPSSAASALFTAMGAGAATGVGGSAVNICGGRAAKELSNGMAVVMDQT